MAARSEIRSGIAQGPVWLLDWTIAGHTYRIGSEAVVVTDAAGLDYQYEEGLVPPEVTDDSTGVVELGVELAMSINWALLDARGMMLERRPAMLRRWWPGQVLERAEVIIAGSSYQVSYGAAGETLSMSIRDVPSEDSRPVVDSTAVMDDNTFPISGGAWLPESLKGQYYPIPIGYPGNVPGGNAQPAVPAPPCDFQTGLTTSQCMVADRVVEATSVRLHNLSTDPQVDQSANVSQSNDLLGREVSLLTFGVGGAAFGGESDAYWYGMSTSTGGGVYGDDGNALRGALDVIQWVLRERSSVLIDRPMMQGAEALNAYRVDTYINADVNAWEWVERGLLPWLPVVVRSGPHGKYLRLVRWEAQTHEAVLWLDTADSRVSRDGRISRLNQPIYNEFTVRYGPRGGNGWQDVRVVTASTELQLWSGGYIDTSTDDRIIASHLCRHSQAEYGRRPMAEVQLAWTWDPETALRVGLDLAARYAAPKRVARYTGPWELLEHLEPWDVIVLTDAEVSITAEPCLVQARTIGAGSVSLDLIILDHPVHESISTT